MNAQVTMSDLIWNPGMRSFFFRSQAWEQFASIIEKISNDDFVSALEKIDDYFDNIDDCEEFFYNEDEEYIIATLELPVMEEA